MKRLERVVKSCSSWLGSAGLALSAVFVVALAFLVVFAVVVRGLRLGVPTSWVEETTRYMLVYITYLPLSWLLARGLHIRVDVLTSRLRGRGQSVAEIVSCLVGLAVCSVFIWQSSQLTILAYHRGQVWDNVKVPFILALIPMPVGWSLFALQLLLNLIDHVRVVGHGERT